VRPGLGVHLPLRLLLDPVVPDRGRGVEALVDVRLGQLFDQPGLDGVRRPDAGVAVGLELRTHRSALGALAVVSDLLEHAELVLDVVAVLVRDHVGLRERAAAGAEARLKLVEEPEVDVDLLVARAVERPNLRAREAAARLHLVGEEDGVGIGVLAATTALEDAVPEALHAVDDADDAAVLPLVRVFARLAFLRDLAGCITLAHLLVLQRRQLAESATAGEQHEEQINDQRTAAEASPAEREPAAAHPAAANVGYLVGVEAGTASKAHDGSLAWAGARKTRRSGFLRLARMSTAAAQQPNAVTWAARIALAGPLLSIALVALLHVLEPEVNENDAVSEHALGDLGWLMNVAFFSGAAGTGALAFVLHRSLARSKTAVAGVILLSIAAVAWVLLGAGNIDPEGADMTTHGLIHGVGFLLGLPARLAAPLVLAAAFRRDERWANHRPLTLAFGIAALLAEIAGFSDLASVVTLRLALGLWLIWVALTGARVLRERPGP
jgi:Protein of unknown function (DUF998)